MKPKAGLPERVSSNEGLGVTAPHLAKLGLEEDAKGYQRSYRDRRPGCKR